MSDSETTIRCQQAKSRSGMYGLLYRIYHHEPDPQLLTLFSQKIFTDHLSQKSKQTIFPINEKVLNKLGIEFTRLFIGPGPHLSPHESVQTADDIHRLFGKSMESVQAYMDFCGFQPERSDRLLADHLSLEMQLMQFLTQHEYKSFANANIEQADKFKKLQIRFLREHIFLWVRPFCRKIKVMTTHPFFSDIANWTDAFVRSEYMVYKPN